MDPLTGAAIGGAAKLLGGGLSAIFGRGGREREAQAYDEYIKSLQNAGIADPEAYVAQYGFVDPEQLQTFNPLLESQIAQDDSELSNIQLDPLTRQVQMDALSKMVQRGQEGLTAEEEAARNDIIRKVGAQNQSNQESVLQNMAQRGMLGSGQELAARLAGAQNAYESQAQQAEALAAARDNRALQATQEAANLGSGIRSQDYGISRDAASAQDIINQFNVRNAQDVQTRNVGAQNVAGQGQADLRNKAYLSNLDLQNKQADQRMQGGLSNLAAKNQQSQAVAQAGLQKATQGKANQAQTLSGIGGMISGAADAFTGYTNAKASQDLANKQLAQQDSQYNKLLDLYKTQK